MNQAKADASDDLFTTETAGLPEVLGPGVTRLHDGDRLDLRIGPVRKNIDGAERVVGGDDKPGQQLITARHVAVHRRGRHPELAGDGTQAEPGGPVGRQMPPGGGEDLAGDLGAGPLAGGPQH